MEKSFISIFNSINDRFFHTINYLYNLLNLDN